MHLSQEWQENMAAIPGLDLFCGESAKYAEKLNGLLDCK